MKFSEGTLALPAPCPQRDSSEETDLDFKHPGTGGEMRLEMGVLDRLPDHDRTLQLRPSRTPECPQVPFRDVVTLENIVTVSKQKNHSLMKSSLHRKIPGGLGEGQSALNPLCFARTQF